MLAVLDFDAASFSFKTTDLLSLDDEYFSQGKPNQSPFPPPNISVDRLGRCAAFPCYKNCLAVFPFSNGTTWNYTPLFSNYTATNILKWRPYILSLPDIAPHLTPHLISSITFLPDFETPTLAILFDKTPSWVGAAPLRSDTKHIIVVSLPPAPTFVPLALTNRLVPYHLSFLFADPVPVSVDCNVLTQAHIPMGSRGHVLSQHSVQIPRVPICTSSMHPAFIEVVDKIVEYEQKQRQNVRIQDKKDKEQGHKHQDTSAATSSLSLTSTSTFSKDLVNPLHHSLSSFGDFQRQLLTSLSITPDVSDVSDFNPLSSTTPHSSTIVWQSAALPSDSFAIHPTPSAFEGVFVLSPSSILHVTSETRVALAANAWADLLPPAIQDETDLLLDRSEFGTDPDFEDPATANPNKLCSHHFQKCGRLASIELHLSAMKLKMSPEEQKDTRESRLRDDPTADPNPFRSKRLLSCPRGFSFVNPQYKGKIFLTLPEEEKNEQARTTLHQMATSSPLGKRTGDEIQPVGVTVDDFRRSLKRVVEKGYRVPLSLEASQFLNVDDTNSILFLKGGTIVQLSAESSQTHLSGYQKRSLSKMKLIVLADDSLLSPECACLIQKQTYNGLSPFVFLGSPSSSSYLLRLSAETALVKYERPGRKPQTKPATVLSISLEDVVQSVGGINDMSIMQRSEEDIQEQEECLLNRDLEHPDLTEESTLTFAHKRRLFICSGQDTEGSVSEISQTIRPKIKGRVQIASFIHNKVKASVDDQIEWDESGDEDEDADQPEFWGMDENEAHGNRKKKKHRKEKPQLPTALNSSEISLEQFNLHPETERLLKTKGEKQFKGAITTLIKTSKLGNPLFIHPFTASTVTTNLVFHLLAIVTDTGIVVVDTKGSITAEYSPPQAGNEPLPRIISAEALGSFFLLRVFTRNNTPIRTVVVQLNLQYQNGSLSVILEQINIDFLLHLPAHVWVTSSSLSSDTTTFFHRTGQGPRMMTLPPQFSASQTPLTSQSSLLSFSQPHLFQSAVQTQSSFQLQSQPTYQPQTPLFANPPSAPFERPDWLTPVAAALDDAKKKEMARERAKKLSTFNLFGMVLPGDVKEQARPLVPSETKAATKTEDATPLQVEEKPDMISSIIAERQALPLSDESTHLSRMTAPHFTSTFEEDNEEVLESPFQKHQPTLYMPDMTIQVEQVMFQAQPATAPALTCVEISKNRVRNNPESSQTDTTLKNQLIGSILRNWHADVQLKGENNNPTRGGPEDSVVLSMVDSAGDLHVISLSSLSPIVSVPLLKNRQAKPPFYPLCFSHRFFAIRTQNPFLIMLLSDGSAIFFRSFVSDVDGTIKIVPVPISVPPPFNAITLPLMIHSSEHTFTSLISHFSRLVQHPDCPSIKLITTSTDSFVLVTGYHPLFVFCPEGYPVPVFMASTILPSTSAFIPHSIVVSSEVDTTTNTVAHQTRQVFINVHSTLLSLDLDLSVVTLPLPTPHSALSTYVLPGVFFTKLNIGATPHFVLACPERNILVLGVSAKIRRTEPLDTFVEEDDAINGSTRRSARLNMVKESAGMGSTDTIEVEEPCWFPDVLYDQFAIIVLSLDTMRVEARFLLDVDEHITTMKIIPLKSNYSSYNPPFPSTFSTFTTEPLSTGGEGQKKKKKQNTDPATFTMKHLVVVGTSLTIGESTISSGRLLIFDVLEQPNSSNGVEHSLCLLAEQQENFGFTAVAPLTGGFLMTSSLEKVCVYRLDRAQSLSSEAFLQIGAYIRTMTTLQCYVVLTDINDIVYLLIWRADQRFLNKIAQSTQMTRPVAACLGLTSGLRTSVESVVDVPENITTRASQSVLVAPLLSLFSGAPSSAVSLVQRETYQPELEAFLKSATSIPVEPVFTLDESGDLLVFRYKRQDVRSEGVTQMVGTHGVHVGGTGSGLLEILSGESEDGPVTLGDAVELDVVGWTHEGCVFAVNGVRGGENSLILRALEEVMAVNAPLMAGGNPRGFRQATMTNAVASVPDETILDSGLSSSYLSLDAVQHPIVSCGCSDPESQPRMSYDKVTFIDRRGSKCIKWDIPANHPDPIFMWVADTDIEVPGPVMEAIQKRAAFPVFGYPIVPPEMAQSIKSWCQRRFDWEIETPWISFTTGVCIGMSQCIQALGRPGDSVVLLSPVYYPMTTIPTALGFHVLRSSLTHSSTTNKWEIDWKDLEEKLARPTTTEFIFCSPHNPCGRVWTKEELQRMGDLCVKHNVSIISDEIHWDFILPELDAEGNPVSTPKPKHIPMASVSDAISQITVTLSAPSKTFNVPALQLSYMIAKNPKMRLAIKQQMDRQSLSFIESIFGFEALPVAYGQCEGWVDAIDVHYARMARKVQTFCNDPKYSKFVKSPKHESTFLMLLDFNGAIEYFKYTDKDGKVVYPLSPNRCPKTGKWLVEPLDPVHPSALVDCVSKLSGVVLQEGYMFGEEAEGWLRMNIGAKPETVDEALRRLGVMFDELLAEKKKREES
ncbi:Cystathionine beta-lyase [Blattamonas nauphoetae]|uniref:cysteine-S-conjugate beta-lyase n=1 Tax=Blattamonas nauphoetae TaxID=2049346 RepID=A0ABQ9XQ84_9EUKA|nr:Cystathionine beta-lyase [Blattamonas nauphoetae]